jgi:hypothetical protein
MKKILLLAAVTISIISCSKSDSSESSTDKIVGKWVETSATSQIGANGTPTSILEQCATLGNISFSATSETSGTFINTYYYPNSTTFACELQPIASGTWTNLGNNTYNTMYSGQTGVDVTTVNFSNNDRTMLVTLYDGGNYIIKTTYAKQ